MPGFIVDLLWFMDRIFAPDISESDFQFSVVGSMGSSHFRPLTGVKHPSKFSLLDPTIGNALLGWSLCCNGYLIRKGEIQMVNILQKDTCNAIIGELKMVLSSPPRE